VEVVTPSLLGTRPRALQKFVKTEVSH